MHAPPPRGPKSDLRRQALQKRGLEAFQAESHVLQDVLEDGVQASLSLNERSEQASTSGAQDAPALPEWNQYWTSRALVDVPGRWSRQGGFWRASQVTAIV